MVEPGLEIQKAEVLFSVTGSRKISRGVLELSKIRLYLLLHGIFAGIVLLYQCTWLFSTTTEAVCYAYRGNGPGERVIDPGTLVYHYTVNGQLFTETTTRNEMPLTQHNITVRYLNFLPSVSRPDNFIGNWAGFIIAWGIFFVISTMIFFIPNDTMPKNSYFYFTKKKPWINMIVK